MKLFRNCKNYMGRSRGKGIYAILAAMVLVTACAGRTKALGTDSPQEAVESVMQSIKELDLETFNAYTDNYEGMSWNFIGFWVEKEYKVFQDLLQPRTWEIGKAEEKEGGRKATLELTLTNKDIGEAIERYTMWVMEDAVNDAGFGVVPLVKNLSIAINECDDDLIRFIDETEEMRTVHVTVTAYEEGGKWKVHLTDEFINAFMGDIDSEE